MANEPANGVDRQAAAGARDGRPRPAWCDRALSPGQTAVLGSMFVLVWTVLTVTLFALWPLIEPVPQGAASPARPFPGFGPLRWTLTPDAALILLVVVVSALGSFVHAATSFSTYVGNQRLYGSWVWWYLLRVFIGATLALLVYFVIRGGFFSSDASSTALNPYGIAAVAGLSGLFSKQATDKLREVFDTVLSTGHGGGDDERADKATHPRPVLERLLPSGCLVRGGELSLVVEGRGFLRDTTIHVRRVGGTATDRTVAGRTVTDRTVAGRTVTDGTVAGRPVVGHTVAELTLDPVFIDGSRLQVLLPGGLVGEPAVLELVAENRQPGGGRSNALAFTVSRLPQQSVSEAVFRST